MTKLGTLLWETGPSPENPRNSEGAFLDTESGGLLFAYSRYRGASWNDDAACDIALIRSRDGGLHWSMPEILVRAAEFGVDNIMSVSSLTLKNGDPALFFLIKKPNGTIDFGVIRSTDGGDTFLPARECVREYIPAYYVMNNDRVDRLSDGRVVFPLGQHRMAVPVPGNGYRQFERYASAAFFAYDEETDTVSQLPGTILLDETAYSRTGLQEPGIVERSGGVIWAYCRTDRGAQYESFSVDGAQTFTPARQSPFTSPPSPMKIKRDPLDGTLYAVWNPIPNYNGRALTAEGWGRTPLVIAGSRDDGRTWSPPQIVEDDEARGFCYPALHFTGDGCLLLAYCCGGPGDGACLNRLAIRSIPLGRIGVSGEK